jgi:hypothetical protein
MRLFEIESSPFSFQQVRGGGSLIDREKPKKKKKNDCCASRSR